MFNYLISRMSNSRSRLLLCIGLIALGVFILIGTNSYITAIKQEALNVFDSLGVDLVVVEKADTTSLVPSIDPRVVSNIGKIGSVKSATALRVENKGQFWILKFTGSSILLSNILGENANLNKSYISEKLSSVNLKPFGIEPETTRKFGFDNIFFANSIIKIADFGNLPINNQASLLLLNSNKSISLQSTIDTINANFQDLEAITPREFIDRLDIFIAFRNISFLCWCIAFFLIAAATCLMPPNAVGERQVELFTMRAVGWQRRFILLTSLLEVSLVALLGVTAGIVLSLLLSLASQFSSLSLPISAHYYFFGFTALAWCIFASVIPALTILLYKKEKVAAA